jgi:hypothetical protein
MKLMTEMSCQERWYLNRLEAAWDEHFSVKMVDQSVDINGSSAIFRTRHERLPKQQQQDRSPGIAVQECRASSAPAAAGCWLMCAVRGRGGGGRERIYNVLMKTTNGESVTMYRVIYQQWCVEISQC